MQAVRVARSLHASALVGVLLLVSAVARGAAPPIDACALLDAAHIDAVLAASVDPGVRRDAGIVANGAYSAACVWTVKAGPGFHENPAAPLGGRSFVILNVLRWPRGSDGARTYLDEFRLAGDRGELPGQISPRQFGDEALWWGDGLAVRRRDVSFGISVFAAQAAVAKSSVREEQLARLILARLAAQDVVARR